MNQNHDEAMARNFDRELFLELLSKIPQKEYRLHPEQDPTQFWVFENIDYKQWFLSSNGMLWISSSSDTILKKISANVVGDVKRAGVGHILYVTCESGTVSSDKRPLSTQLVHTLLNQLMIIESSIWEMDQSSLMAAYLMVLVNSTDSLPAPNTNVHVAGYSPDCFVNIVTKALDFPSEYQWSALSAAVRTVFGNRVEQITVIVVEGAGVFRNDMDHLSDVHEFLAKMQETLPNFRALTTLNTPISAPKNWVVIDHERERKGM